MIRLLISGSVLCVIVNWRILDMTLLFCPDAAKIYIQTISVTVSK